MIKGGGGALTREKIVAQASEKFVCIADESKVVKQLGAFPPSFGSHSDGCELCLQSNGRFRRSSGLFVISLRTTETTSSMYTVFRLKNRSCWKTQSIRFRALSPAEFLPTEARTSSWSLLKRASKLRSLRRASSLPARLSNQVLLKRSGVENAAPFC